MNKKERITRKYNWLVTNKLKIAGFLWRDLVKLKYLITSLLQITAARRDLMC